MAYSHRRIFGCGTSGHALEVALVEEGGALLALERQDVRGHPVQEVPAHKAGSYLRLIDFASLNLSRKDLLGPVTRVQKKKKKYLPNRAPSAYRGTSSRRKRPPRGTSPIKKTPTKARMCVATRSRKYLPSRALSIS